MKYRVLDTLHGEHATRHEGRSVRLPVTLSLRLREPEKEPPHHVLSWRTERAQIVATNNRNRRNYWESGAYWTIPAPLAVRLFQDAEASGWFASRYDDPRLVAQGQRATPIVSTACGEPERRQLLAAITCPEREPAWVQRAEFVIAPDPNAGWRKVMLVDEARTTVTFRSCKASAAGTWQVDKDMIDCNIQGMRAFWHFLRRS